MTNGMPMVARFAVKPIATMVSPLPSVDLDTGEPVQAHYERSDVCQVPPAGVIGEAMVGSGVDRRLHGEVRRRFYQGDTPQPRRLLKNRRSP